MNENVRKNWDVTVVNRRTNEEFWKGIVEDTTLKDVKKMCDKIYTFENGFKYKVEEVAHVG